MTGEDDALSVSVRVTIRRVGASGFVVETDPAGLVPEGMDVESAFMRLGGEMLRRLSSTPRPREAARFARRPRLREGS